MTDPITNPDAEAKALAAKSPPPLPSGSILGVTAEQAKNAAPVRTVDPAKVAAAIASITAARQSINTAGDVTGDLALATSGCTTALKHFNIAAAKIAPAAPKA